jgi:hypothetical protein
MAQEIVYQEAAGEIPDRPRARAGMWRRLWDGLGIPALLEQVGIGKYSGMPAEPLLFVYALFGVVSAVSVQHLVTLAGKDELLLDLLPVLEQLNDKALRYLLKHIEVETYQKMQGEVIQVLQAYPGMTSQPEGVVSGDDTIEFKEGEKMPGIQVLFKASEGRYHLGYCIVSTHYADDQKDYPLLFDIRRRSEAEEAAAAEKKEQKSLELDLRKPAAYLQWIEYQVAQGAKPALAVLSGPRFNPKIIQAVEQQGVPWLGVSPRNRVYEDEQGRSVTTKSLLRLRMNERVCLQLPDCGQQVLVKTGKMKGGGAVTFLITEDVARGERTLFVVSGQQPEPALAWLDTYLSWQQTEVETKLHQMVELVTKVRTYGLRAETASFDRWYYVAWFIRQVLAAGYQRVVVPDRADRSYTYQGQSMSGQAIRDTLAPTEFKPAHYRGKKCQMASRRVQHDQLGEVKLVFVQELNQKNQPPRLYILLCTDPDYPDELVYRAHKLRWKIEEGYREMRQQHGFGAFHGQNWNALYGHLTFVFLSLLFTITIRRWNRNLADQTLGWVKHNYLNVLVELEQEADRLVVRFSRGFLQQFGLFQLIPTIGYVDW